MNERNEKALARGVFESMSKAMGHPPRFTRPYALPGIAIAAMAFLSCIVFVAVTAAVIAGVSG